MYNYINNQVDSAVSVRVYITFYHLVLKMWLIRESSATGGDGKINCMQSQGVMSVELVKLAYKVSRIMENLKLNKSDVI